MKKTLTFMILFNWLPIALAGPQDRWIYAGPRYDVVVFLIAYFAILYLLAKKMKVIRKK